MAQNSNRNNKNNRNDDCWDKNCDDRGIEEDQPLLKPFNRKQLRFSIILIVIGIAVMLIINSFISRPDVTAVEYSEFKNLIREGQIERVEINETQYIGFSLTRDAAGDLSEEERQNRLIRYSTNPVDDPGFIELLDTQNVEYYSTVQGTRPFVSVLLNWILPLGFIFLIWRLLFRRMGAMGSNVMSFGRNKSQLVAEGETGVRFDDVAGAEESKEELMEVVDFLKNPRRYTDIGGKIPKGVLLVGAPGTGKTLLAKAVAGEAGVPFFRMSGADFVEMFVGVGAARVRDLFRQAREKSPCIIFIDELDAVGKSRQTSIGSNDEREQTLNQLLVEMDGFDARTGVIMLGATNRPEILDQALLRPGRFDRQILIDKPDLNGRKAILEIHSQGVKIDGSVDLEKVARATPGLVGADLANIVNEAALLAVRFNREVVLQEDFSQAIEKVMAGLEKKNRLIHPKEREIVAYHETGHALTAQFTEGADPVEKISIIPRGFGALGYTLQLPEDERYLLTRTELIGKIDILLGGRAAEEVIYSEISTGAANDLTRATEIVRKMITEYGMSEKFSNVYLPNRRTSMFLGEENYTVNREYAETTQQYIDEEIARLIRERYDHVKKLLQEKKELLKSIASKLMEKETLESEDFRELLGKGEKRGN